MGTTARSSDASGAAHSLTATRDTGAKIAEPPPRAKRSALLFLQFIGPGCRRQDCRPSPASMPSDDPAPSARFTPPWVLLLTVVFLLGLLAVGLLLTSDDSGKVAARAAGLRAGQLPQGLENRPAAAFDLPSARGGRISSAQLAGRPYAITFLYTSCPDICPVIGQQIRTALRALGPTSAGVAAVAVSVDPKGDSPAAVRRWLKRQRLPQNFSYAVGSEKQLRATWKAYFAVPEIDGRPDSTAHAGAVWLVDARGLLRARYSGDELLSPADLASDLRTLVAEGRP